MFPEIKDHTPLELLTKPAYSNMATTMLSEPESEQPPDAEPMFPFLKLPQGKVAKSRFGNM